MNLQRWIGNRRPLWEQLEALLQVIDRRGLASLTREQLRQLGRLYRSASADLSRVRSLNFGSDTQIYLNNLVIKGHNQVYQRNTRGWSDISRFIRREFPCLVKEKIVYITAAALLMLLPVIASYFAVIKDIDFAHMEVMPGSPLVSEELWQIIEKHQMWTDATAGYSPLASSAIATNNIRVAILAFAYGVTFALGTVFVLAMNGMMLGTVFGVCSRFGLFNNLLAFVAPHGALELTAIFISGGAGLYLGKALLFPGRLRRVDALKLAARPAAGLFCGCLPILLLAGLIEGFLSPRTDVSAAEKFAVSLATIICLLLYLFTPAPAEGTRG